MGFSLTAIDLSTWADTAIAWIANINSSSGGMLDLMLGMIVAASALILTYKTLKGDGSTTVNINKDNNT